MRDNERTHFFLKRGAERFLRPCLKISAFCEFLNVENPFKSYIHLKQNYNFFNKKLPFSEPKIVIYEVKLTFLD